jgi:hypothetical protein
MPLGTIKASQLIEFLKKMLPLSVLVLDILLSLIHNSKVLSGLREEKDLI